MSKGSRSRITNKRRYDENYDEIFRKKCVFCGNKITSENKNKNKEFSDVCKYCDDDIREHMNDNV